MMIIKILNSNIPVTFVLWRLPGHVCSIHNESNFFYEPIEVTRIYVQRGMDFSKKVPDV